MFNKNNLMVLLITSPQKISVSTSSFDPTNEERVGRNKKGEREKEDQEYPLTTSIWKKGKKQEDFCGDASSSKSSKFS